MDHSTPAPERADEADTASPDTGGTATAPTPANTAADSMTVEYGTAQRRLAYAEYGATGGDPAVFLHGTPGSRRLGALLDAAASEAGVRLIAPDRPGFGRSTDWTGRRPTDAAAWVEPLLADAGVDRARVVAFSGGAADALAADAVPDRLGIVGGGYIGMELATTFAKLGADVTVVEMLDDILDPYEDDVKRIVRKRAAELGVTFRFGEGASEWSEGGDGGYLLHTETEDGEASSYPVDKILVAVGRQPVTDGLDLKNAGVETDDRGFIETDDRTRTGIEHIHAVGDVAGDPMLAHAASKEGIVAAEVIAGEPAAMDQQAIPAAVFTDPEIGTVGLTEAEAEAEGFDPVVGEMPFNASGRAMTTGHTEGFVRIVADDETGFVLGAQIVGPEASELVAELGLAIEMGARLADVAATVHTHPTLAEAVREACANALGKAVHTLNR